MPPVLGQILVPATLRFSRFSCSTAAAADIEERCMKFFDFRFGIFENFFVLLKGNFKHFLGWLHAGGLDPGFRQETGRREVPQVGSRGAA